MVKFNEVKINKKLQKALTIISPPPPPPLIKHSTPNIIAANDSQTLNYNTSSTFEMKSRIKLKEPEMTHPKA